MTSPCQQLGALANWFQVSADQYSGGYRNGACKSNVLVEVFCAQSDCLKAMKRGFVRAGNDRNTRAQRRDRAHDLVNSCELRILNGGHLDELQPDQEGGASSNLRPRLTLVTSGQAT